jgi:hypothetical protein
MVRKLILAATAVVALSAQAQAGNSSTTVQAGGFNSASTSQFTVFGNNASTTVQAAVFSNSQTTGQVTLNPFGSNHSTVIQVSLF